MTDDGSLDLLAPPDEVRVRQAVDAFAEAMRQRYGARLSGIYLFGSRARGDFEPYSDVDVAVVLGGGETDFADTKALSDIAYNLLLETGAEIQPWLFGQSEWSDRASRDALVNSVRRDAQVVWQRT